MYSHCRYLRLAQSALLALVFIALPAQAVPNTLNYQGQLTIPSGRPVNATVGITFNLYAAATGGVALWSETQNVAVSYGLYSVTLGKTVPLVPGWFDAPLYLGITVASDAEMTPRIALSSAPYALKANDADTAGGLPAAQLRTGIPWVDVTGTSLQAASNTRYVADNAALVTLTLPAAPAIGDIIGVTGAGAGGWMIVVNAGQSILSKNISGGTPSAGAISGGLGDTIVLQYIGNNKFAVLNYMGSLTVTAG